MTIYASDRTVWRGGGCIRTGRMGSVGWPIRHWLSLWSQVHHDLEQAIRYALEPLSHTGGWGICAACGAVRGNDLDPEHECRPLEIPGAEYDAKRRAKSYCIE